VRPELDTALAKGSLGFASSFEQTFALAKKGYRGRLFDEEELAAAKAALGNMVGGMGFFHGRAVIKDKDGGGTLQVMRMMMMPVGRRSSTY
jgi:mannosyl-oligosaccharide glucosidase